MKYSSHKAGFTLLELVVSVALFTIALSISVFAVIGSNSLIQRSDARASITESMRTVNETSRRVSLNVSPDEVFIVGKCITANCTINTLKTFNGQNVFDATNYISVGFMTAQYNDAQKQVVCQFVSRANPNTTPQGEELFTPDPNGTAIALQISSQTSGLCDLNNTQAIIYQNRLTDKRVNVTKFDIGLLTYPDPTTVCLTGCVTTQQLRIREAAELGQVQIGANGETRKPSLEVITSIPVGLL